MQGEGGGGGGGGGVMVTYICVVVTPNGGGVDPPCRNVTALCYCCSDGPHLYGTSPPMQKNGTWVGDQVRLDTGACIVDHSSHSRTSNIDKGGKQFGAPTTMLSNFPKRKILKPQTYQV